MSGTSLLSPSEQSDPWLYKLPSFPSAAQQPLKAPSLSPADQNASFSHVAVAGKLFPAMWISGEPRVPLELLKRRCLEEFSKFKVQGLSGDLALQYLIVGLNVHLYTASPEQVSKLRTLDDDLLQDKAVCMQLITQTDAERVFGLMRDESKEPPHLRRSNGLRNAFISIPVSHWLAGDEALNGTLYPERKGGRCIQCEECNKWFTPEDFVVHSHVESETQENMRVVHWGLRTDNWREMIVPSNDAMVNDELSRAFEDFMSLEDKSATKRASNSIEEEEDSVCPAKRLRISTSSPSPSSSIKLSKEVASVLENISQLPAISYDLMASLYDAEMLCTNEAKLRAKATVEAMNGKMFDMVGSSKGLSAQDLQEKALQLIRNQQPYLPDPEAFPKTAMARGGSADLLQVTEMLKTLEQSFPDGKPNPEAQQLIDNMRRRLQHDAYQLQQQEIVYSVLLSSYKMLSLLWRHHADPSQAVPKLGKEDGNFEDLQKELAALDPMKLLGANVVNGVKTVPIPAPPQKSPMMSKGASMPVDNNLMWQLLKSMSAAATSPPQKGCDLPTPQPMQLNPLINMLSGAQPDLLKMFTANGAFKAPLLSNSTPTKHAASLLQPLSTQLLPTVPAGPGLLSPKQIFNDPGRSEAVSRFQTALLAPANNAQLMGVPFSH